jgi:hypothetical protein
MPGVWITQCPIPGCHWWIRYTSETKADRLVRDHLFTVHVEDIKKISEDG